MPAYMKEHYGEKTHPGHEKFIELVRKGCPRCGEKLFQKGGFPIGLVFCNNMYSCSYEFQYNGEGKWIIGNDGKPGNLNERFRSTVETNAYREKRAALRNRKKRK